MITAIADSLTVEFSRTPGKTFHRKILSKFSQLLIAFISMFIFFN